MARCHGLALRKSGRRDPRAIDYGMYAIIDADSNRIVAGAASGQFNLTLDDVEAYFTDEAADNVR
jgi:hypothetical protein